MKTTTVALIVASTFTVGAYVGAYVGGATIIRYPLPTINPVWNAPKHGEDVRWEFTMFVDGDGCKDLFPNVDKMTPEQDRAALEKCWIRFLPTT